MTRPSSARPRVLLVVLTTGLAAALVAASAGRSASAPRRVEQLAAADDSCLVARGEGFELTLGEVRRLRQAQTPTPALDAATRLALDVRLAQWLASGRFDPAALPHEQLQGYRAEVSTLLRQGERRVRAAFARAREDLGVTTGPCYMARGAP